MEDYDFLKTEENTSSKDAKWNIFRYQDHLKDVMEVCYTFRINGDHLAWFHALSGMMTRGRPFFDDKEKEKIDVDYNNALSAYNELTQYNNRFKSDISSGRKVRYCPNNTLPMDLHKFEQDLLDFLQKHGLLMKVVKKGDAGAGDA